MARSHERIVGEAARLLRRMGVERMGLKEVMGAAGMTHGGFYRHFADKDALVLEALDSAFEDMVALMDASAGELDSEPVFERQRGFYLSDTHLDGADRGCPAAALGSEIARGDAELKARFGAGLERIVARLAGGLSGTVAERGERAWREFAMMAGAVILARASDPQHAARLLAAVRAGPVGPRRRTHPSE